MKQFGLLLALFAGLMLGACGGESKLPTPSGKASVTAINAIYGSPAINFLIEERSLGSVTYKGTTAAANYDDLDYTFNFDVAYAGDSEFTRIASQYIDFVADQQYTLLASGPLSSPTITVWETARRDFTDTDTVFQVRFAHTSYTYSDIDVYFALDGVAPVLGEQVASLTFGEITAPMDFEGAEYVVTITTAGDPADILYQSSPSTILARTDLIISPFDGDANDTAPIVVRGLNSLGGGATFGNPLYPPTVEFLHASWDMGISDVYDDEALTSQILDDHDFKQLTPETPIDVGDYQFYYTPAGDTATVTLDTAFAPANGIHFRVIAHGSGGEYATTNIGLNRRSIETAVKLNLFSASSNFDFVDLYVVNADETIDGFAPFRTGIISRQPNATSDMQAGSFDFYLTRFIEKDIIAGPLRVDVELGDVLDLVIFDTDNTDTLEMVLLPNP
jgi:hypothetical protein